MWNDLLFFPSHQFHPIRSTATTNLFTSTNYPHANCIKDNKIGHFSPERIIIVIAYRVTYINLHVIGTLFFVLFVYIGVLPCIRAYRAVFNLCTFVCRGFCSHPPFLSLSSLVPTTTVATQFSYNSNNICKRRQVVLLPTPTQPKKINHFITPSEPFYPTKTRHGLRKNDIGHHTPSPRLGKK